MKFKNPVLIILIVGMLSVFSVPANVHAQTPPLQLKWLVTPFNLSNNEFFWTHHIPDINGDRRSDVLAKTSTMLYTLSSKDGSIISSMTVSASPMQSTPAEIADDHTGDGIPEVVIALVGKVVMIDPVNFGQIWQVSNPNFGGIALPVPDVTGDGKQDIATGLTSGTTVNMLDGMTGNIVWVISYISGLKEIKSVGRDLDNDSVPDVFINLTKEVRAVSGRNGATIWSFPVCPTCSVLSSAVGVTGINPMFFVREIVPDSNVPGVFHQIIVALKYDGALVWSTPQGQVDYDTVLSAKMDINSDGYEDIITSQGNQFTKAVSGLNGSVLWEQKPGNPANGGIYYGLIVSRMRSGVPSVLYVNDGIGTVTKLNARTGALVGVGTLPAMGPYLITGSDGVESSKNGVSDDMIAALRYMQGGNWSVHPRYIFSFGE